MLFFDLGNVLLYFDHEQACRQMAEVAGLEPSTVRRAVFDSGLQHAYECGQVSTRQFYEEFCRATGTRPDFSALCEGAAAIFRPNAGIRPLVAHLAAAGHRLALLSNTCEVHWEYVANGRYGSLLEAFSPHVLSYRVGLAKPQPEIYQAALELAGVHAAEAFFTDDRPENVEAARAVGIDAVLFTGVAALYRALRRRGVECNY
jgi:putative hydrolase of the HAD superfamily